MKNRTVLFMVLGIVALVILGIYYFRDRRTYELNLPQLENLKSISLEQNTKGKVISDNEEILLYGTTI